MSPLDLVLQVAQEPEAVEGVWRRLAGRGEDPGAFMRALLIVVIGVPTLLAASRWARGWVGARYTPQQGMVASKLLLYAGLLLVLVTFLDQLDFSLTPLLGAAGIVGIALGFASQTSVSNVISGLFLIGERPFEVDDLIQVGDTVGRVLSIDTLSVKLRTFDNRFVRIPNETIVKSQVTTITRFPIRRLDLNASVAYKEDVARVREVLLEVADANPQALMEPEPKVLLDAYGDSGLELRLTVWATRVNFIALKNSLLEEVKARFDQEGIEIPFPHRSLYAGEATAPFPVRLVAGALEGDAGGAPDDPGDAPEGDPGADRDGAGGAAAGPRDDAAPAE